MKIITEKGIETVLCKSSISKYEFYHMQYRAYSTERTSDILNGEKELKQVGFPFKNIFLDAERKHLLSILPWMDYFAHISDFPDSANLPEDYVSDAMKWFSSVTNEGEVKLAQLYAEGMQLALNKRDSKRRSSYLKAKEELSGRLVVNQYDARISGGPYWQR